MLFQSNTPRQVLRFGLETWWKKTRQIFSEEIEFHYSVITKETSFFGIIGLSGFWCRKQKHKVRSWIVSNNLRASNWVFVERNQTNSYGEMKTLKIKIFWNIWQFFDNTIQSKLQRMEVYQWFFRVIFF